MLRWKFGRWRKREAAVPTYLPLASDLSNKSKSPTLETMIHTLNAGLQHQLYVKWNRAYLTHNSPPPALRSNFRHTSYVCLWKEAYKDLVPRFITLYNVHGAVGSSAVRRSQDLACLPHWCRYYSTGSHLVSYITCIPDVQGLSFRLR